MNEETDLVKELSEAVASGKVIYGKKELFRAINKKEKINKILYANNMPKDILDELKKHASEITIEKFEGNSVELGIKCKRSHSILMLGILGNKE